VGPGSGGKRDPGVQLRDGGCRRITPPRSINRLDQHRRVTAAGRRIWPARSCGMPACRSHDPSTDTQGRFKWTRAPAAQHRSRRATPGGDSCGSCRTYCRRVECGFAPSCQGGTRLPSRQCREPGWRDARVLPTGRRSSRRSPDDRRGHGPDSRSVGRPAQGNQPDGGIAEQEDQRKDGIGNHGERERPDHRQEGRAAPTATATRQAQSCSGPEASPSQHPGPGRL
jgi:hypothetical protein